MTLKNNQLSRVVISGYRSIKKCDLELRPLNVLIGSNGAGKSNFISVFTLLQNVLMKNLQLFAAQSGVNALLYNGRKVTDEIDFEAFFDNSSYGFTLVPTDDGRLIFNSERIRENENPSVKIAFNVGREESRWPDAEIAKQFKDLRWRVYHFNDTSRSAKVKQEHNISNNRALLYDAGNLAAFLLRLKNHWPEKYAEIVSTIRLVAPFFSNFILEPREGNNEQIILRWLCNGCEDVFNASQLSDGTLRFICLTTLLLQPRELQPDTIIIDEPELGLHPYAITILAEMIRQLSSEKQIIISTQSVELLDEFTAEDVIVVDRNGNGSQFRRLNSEQLREWLEDDYALSDLWKKNILGGRLSS